MVYLLYLIISSNLRLALPVSILNLLVTHWSDPNQEMQSPTTVYVTKVLRAESHNQRRSPLKIQVDQ